MLVNSIVLNVVEFSYWFQVYCARFSSIEAELSVGMREVDLRTWLKVVDISSAQVCILFNAFIHIFSLF